MTSARTRLRSALILAVLLAPAVLAGCVAKRPTVVFAVTAGEKGLDEFASVEVTLRSVYLQREGEAAQFFPVSEKVDLLKLTAGRLATVTSEPVDPDSYEKVGVEVASVSAVTLDGELKPIRAYNNKLYVVIPFQANKGDEKTFTLALSVGKDPTTGDLVLRPDPAMSKLQ